MKEPNEMSPIERLKAPTPKFFRVVRNIGIIAASVAGAVVALPAAGIAIPAGILAVATGIPIVVGTAGTVAATISQFAVDTKSGK